MYIVRKKPARVLTAGELKELLAESQRGSYDAFEKLIRHYYPQLYGFAGSFVFSDHDAEDILQEALLRSFAALPNFRGDSRLETWFYRIICNCANNFLRHKQHDQAIRKNLRLDLHFRNTNRTCGGMIYYPPHIRRLINLEMQKQARAEFCKLSAQKQKILILYYRKGLKYREISRQLNCPEGTVKTLIYRARQQLIKALQKYE